MIDAAARLEASAHDRRPARSAGGGAGAQPAGRHCPARPSRPVTVQVPFPAGGTADLLARETAHALSEELGQQFIVENRAGAGGNIGRRRGRPRRA